MPISPIGGSQFTPGPPQPQWKKYVAQAEALLEQPYPQDVQTAMNLLNDALDSSPYPSPADVQLIQQAICALGNPDNGQQADIDTALYYLNQLPP